MAEQKFDISINRVEKIPVPLLVVGLGGTGCDTLLTIKEVFAERYILPKDAKGQDLPAPNKTAYLGIDSRSQKPEGFEEGEYVDISLPGIDQMLADQDRLLTVYERSWVNSKLRHSANGNGMGTIRQAARLALSRNYDRVSNAIRGALNNIVSVNAGLADARVTQVEIVVVTGIGGGTGSGIFLDICQILRSIAQAETVIPAKLTGYVVMPDVSLANVSAASGMEGPIRHNSYAALKELDFWMRVKQHEIPYSMQYGNGVTISWDKPPLDYCILMSSSNVAGTPYKDGYKTVRNTIAENLMHYLAKEDSVGAAYSYRQYEDNLAAIDIRKNYPLYYGYRAIGAFTKRIPKKPVLYYEGSILFKTFIPLRDDSDKLQPDRRMFTDGQGKPRAESITGVGKQLMQDFRTNVCKMPTFCYTDLNDRAKVANMQSMNPAPHNKWHTWRDTLSSPAALKAAQDYLDKAWGRFEEFAKGVITDPAQGPFALLAYLDAKDGLISYMEEIKDNWENQYNKVHNHSIADSEKDCAAAWPAFRNPPLIGKKGALEQYDQALKALYTSVNNDQFLEKHVASLKKLILRVKEYLNDGLKPMCDAILFLEKEFGTVEQEDAMLVQDIYDLSTVKQSIDEEFRESNAEDRMSSKFLDKVADISLETQPNVDAKTSGVEFTGHKVGLMEICEFLQKELEEVYGDVNNQSLDDIMKANVGDDVAAQQEWIAKLANSALDSALPMFMQDSVFKSEDKAPYSYMSIPQDAKEHLKYIQTAFATHDPAVEPKASTQKDHIYTLMAWDKLPLYRYGKFEDLRITYDQDLNKESAYGVHLVRNGNPDADYMSDWSQLPSPKPYFLFSSNGVQSEQEQYMKVSKLVEKAVACGMIVVSDERPYVSATVNVLYAEGTSAVLPNNTLKDKADQIAAEKNPATGDVYSRTETAERLKALLATGRKFLLEENDIKPTSIAAVIGLQNEPCDPFTDDTVKADLNKLEKAKKNHKALCVELTKAIIYTRPDLVRALNMQVDAYAEIYDKIQQGTTIETLWQTRYTYAETLAEMLMFLNNDIYPGAEGYMYRDRERDKKYPIITPALLADDLKGVESELLKVLCYLADVPDDNAAKADLIRLMTAAKRKFTDDLNDGSMTKAEMDEMIEAIDDLLKDLKDEQNALEDKKHRNPGMEDELSPQIRMIEEVSKILENRMRYYKKVAKGLD